MTQKLYTIVSLLRSDNFTSVNNDLMKSIGGFEALVLGKILSYANYSYTNNQIDEEGWFKLSKTKLIIELNIGEKILNTLVKNLVELKFIEFKIKGAPATGYFRLHEEIEVRIIDILSPCKPELNQFRQSAELEPAISGTSDPLLGEHIYIKNNKKIKERETEKNSHTQNNLSTELILETPTFLMLLQRFLSFEKYKHLSLIPDIENIVAEEILIEMTNKNEKSNTRSLSYLNDYLMNRLALRYSDYKNKQTVSTTPRGEIEEL